MTNPGDIPENPYGNQVSLKIVVAAAVNAGGAESGLKTTLTAKDIFVRPPRRKGLKPKPAKTVCFFKRRHIIMLMHI